MSKTLNRVPWIVIAGVSITAVGIFIWRRLPTIFRRNPKPKIVEVKDPTKIYITLVCSIRTSEDENIPKVPLIVQLESTHEYHMHMFHHRVRAIADSIPIAMYGENAIAFDDVIISSIPHNSEK